MSGIKVPMTRYYGSKRKLINIIWKEIESLNLEFNSVLDVFGGSATFSYFAKFKGKQVFYNDIFKFNYYIGSAIVRNSVNNLSSDEIVSLFEPTVGKIYSNVIENNFHDIYYTDEENKQLDIIVQNIEDIEEFDKKASAFYILFQACIAKRPYNLFHRKNLNMRLNFKGGSFGNKITWERNFIDLMLKFNLELSNSCFDNHQNNICFNTSALNCDVVADLIYIDPPYFKEKTNTSYHSKYHFLEGLSNYFQIEGSINHNKINKEIIINKNDEFERYDRFTTDLRSLLNIHANSTILLSYRSNGFPSIFELIEIINEFKQTIRVINLGNYGYALNKKNNENFEILIVGS